MAEREALKKEKGETEEARKTAEEQIEAMRKEHEEKVTSISSFCLLIDLYVCKGMSISSRACQQTFAQSCLKIVLL